MRESGAALSLIRIDTIISKSTMTNTAISPAMNVFFSWQRHLQHGAAARRLRRTAARNSRCFFQHRRDRAKIIAERVRGAIIGLAIPHAVNPKQVVTISLGIATMRSSGVGKEQPDAAILATAADGALYEAKRAGRNRVHAAPPLVSVAAERDKAAAARSA